MNIADAIVTVVRESARRHGTLVGLTPQDAARDLMPSIEKLVSESRDPEILSAIAVMQRMGWIINGNHFFIEAVARALVKRRVMGRPCHTSKHAQRRGFYFGVVRDENPSATKKSAVHTGTAKMRSSGRVIAATGQ